MVIVETEARCKSMRILGCFLVKRGEQVLDEVPRQSCVMAWDQSAINVSTQQPTTNMHTA